MTPSELIQAASQARSQGDYQRFRELCESIQLKYPNTPESSIAKQLLDDESESQINSNESASADTKQNLVDKVRTLGAITSIALGVAGIITGPILITGAHEVMDDPFLLLFVVGFVVGPIMWLSGVGIFIAGIALFVGGISRLIRAVDT